MPNYRNPYAQGIPVQNYQYGGTVPYDRYGQNVGGLPASVAANLQSAGGARGWTGGWTPPSTVRGRNMFNTAGQEIPTNWEWLPDEVSHTGSQGLWGQPHNSVAGTYIQMHRPGTGGAPTGQGWGTVGDAMGNYGAGGGYGGPSLLQGGAGTLGAPGMQNQFSSLPSSNWMNQMPMAPQQAPPQQANPYAPTPPVPQWGGGGGYGGGGGGGGGGYGGLF